MTAKTSFQGSFTALVTPFKNGSLDENAFRALVDWQISEGTNGLVPVGTTGESPTLSHREHMLVVEWCVQQANGRLPVGEDDELLVRAVGQLLGSCAQPGRSRLRGGERQYALAIGRHGGEALGQGLRSSRPGDACDQQRARCVSDHTLLLRGGLQGRWIA